MSAQAVETTAVAVCIRDTLDLFLHDHPGLEGADVKVGYARDDQPHFEVCISGHMLTVTVTEGGGEQIP